MFSASGLTESGSTVTITSGEDSKISSGEGGSFFQARSLSMCQVMLIGRLGHLIYWLIPGQKNFWVVVNHLL
ncbi:MAG: hypothetical protein P8P83_01335 [Rickettsiaceae bacterium]|nr:hypothetical protein [Rickettsiaceae bacterium]